MRAISKNVVGFFFKDGADLRMESSSCKIKFAHFITCCEWLHLFYDLPFDAGVYVFFCFVFFISKRDR